MRWVFWGDQRGIRLKIEAKKKVKERNQVDEY